MSSLANHGTSWADDEDYDPAAAAASRIASSTIIPQGSIAAAGAVAGVPGGATAAGATRGTEGAAAAASNATTDTVMGGVRAHYYSRGDY